METLLEVRGLKTHFATDRGLFRAVDGVSFSVPRGRTIGLVGESGCGKSVTSLSVMGLVPSPPGKVEAEAVLFGNRDVLRLSPDERRKLRGSKMSMIFQEPMTSLNPVHTVGQQIVEAALRVGDAHDFEHLARPLARLLAADPRVDTQRLGDLVADGEDRIERGHRLLEDHGDAVASDIAHLRLAERQQVDAVRSG